MHGQVKNGCRVCRTNRQFSKSRGQSGFDNVLYRHFQRQASYLGFDGNFLNVCCAKEDVVLYSKESLAYRRGKAFGICQGPQEHVGIQSIALASSFKRGDDLFWEGSIKILRHSEAPFQQTEAFNGAKWDEPSNRTPSPGNNDFVALFNLFYQTGEMGFCLMNVDDAHKPPHMTKVSPVQLYHCWLPMVKLLNEEDYA